MADAATTQPLEGAMQDHKDLWWAKWRREDYSWDGLAKKSWQGWSVVKDTEEIVETDSLGRREARDATLQDYWRMEETRLIEGDGKRWTRVHCPLVWADRTPSPKRDWIEDHRRVLDTIVSAKIAQAAETTFDGPWDNRELLGADRRAQLQGAVLFGAPSGGALRRMSVCFERVYFAGLADFSRTTFSGDAHFGDTAFSQGVRFDKATFSGDAHFGDATFFQQPGLGSFIQELEDRRVSELLQRIVRVLDDMKVPSSEREQVEQNLMEVVAADLLVRLGTRLSKDDRAQLARIGDAMPGQDPDLNAIAGFFKDRFSRDELIDVLAEAVESVLAEFVDAMRRPGSATAFDGVSYDNATGVSAAISAGARFDNAAYRGAAIFIRAEFYSTANFSEAQFHGHTDFGKVRFTEDADFNWAVFKNNAWFEFASFRAAASFNRTKFADVASFCAAEFRAGVNFEFVRFADRARFEKTRFLEGAKNGELNFNYAQFEGVADFKSAVFPKRCEQFSAAFLSASFDGIAVFRDAGTHWIAAFHGALFKENLILDDPPEKTASAEFRQTILQGTKKTVSADVAKCIETEKKERREKAERDRGSPKEITRTEKRAWASEAPQKRRNELIGGCRTIKNAMTRQGDELMAQRYYRFQLMARWRHTDTPIVEKIFLILYGFASDYGVSMWRSLVGLGVLLVICATFYWTWEAASAGDIFDRLSDAFDRPIDDGVWHAAGYSGSRIAPFGPWADTPAWLATMDEYGVGIGLMARAAGAVETMVAIVLAFLFALAVRRRFQIS